MFFLPITIAIAIAIAIAIVIVSTTHFAVLLILSVYLSNDSLQLSWSSITIDKHTPLIILTWSLFLFLPIPSIYLYHDPYQSLIVCLLQFISMNVCGTPFLLSFLPSFLPSFLSYEALLYKIPQQNSVPTGRKRKKKGEDSNKSSSISSYFSNCFQNHFALH